MHLGIYFNNPNRIEVNDCVSDQFYNYFRAVSHQNTLIYDDVFKCLPSDNILNFEALASYGFQPCLSRNDPVRVSISFNQLTLINYKFRKIKFLGQR